MKTGQFFTGTPYGQLKGRYVVCSVSLRTRATYQGDRLMSKEDAQAWADELNARPINFHSRYSICPADKRYIGGSAGQ